MTSARKATACSHRNRRPARSARFWVVLTAALLGLAAAGLVAQRQSLLPCPGPVAGTPPSPEPGNTGAEQNRQSVSAEPTACFADSLVRDGDGVRPQSPMAEIVGPLPRSVESARPLAPIPAVPPASRWPRASETAAVIPASWTEIADAPGAGHNAPLVAALAEAEQAESPPLPPNLSPGAERLAAEAPLAEASPPPGGQPASSPPPKPRLKLPLFRSSKVPGPAGQEPTTPAESSTAAGQRPGPASPLSGSPPPPSALQGGVKIPLAGSPPAERVTLKQSAGLISLATHNAPLSEVLMALARQQNLNIVCTENLRANITVTLEQVPLETVLDAVLSIAGCTWVVQNNVVYVTSTADRTKLPPAVQGRYVRVFRLDFAAAADVEKAVKGMMSPVGQVFTTVAKNTDNRQTQELVVVEDLPQYLQTIAAYIEEVDQPPRQVLIEAHVLAITLDSTDRCGVDLTALFKVLHHDMSFYAEGFANPAAPQAFFFTFDGSDLDILIEALRTQSQAKTLASPKVLVLNGQEAKIQIGRQDGYRVVTTTETSAMESINFLDTGVLLTVTPRISRNGQVLMQVKPEVSDGQVQDGLPSKKTTEVQTNVMLPDGRGMVIGGLIRDTDNEVQAKVPFFGDLYLVGKLFRRRELTKKREEIIITLIPRVVPGTLACGDRHAEEVQRAETRLLDRNLERIPRPWDGALPDALENPARLRDLPAIKARHQRCAAGCAECLGEAGSACGETVPYYLPVSPAAPTTAAAPAGQAQHAAPSP